ncbi:unnamed protein product [Closterium sp. NIES-54]
MFERRDISSVGVLFEEYFSITLATCDGAVDYVERMQEVADRLATRQAALSEPLQIHRLLFNLTPDYESRLYAFTKANPLAGLPKVTQWIIDTEVKLRTPIVNLTTTHSSTSLNATQPRTQGGRNGGGGGRGGGGGGSRGSGSGGRGGSGGGGGSGGPTPRGSSSASGAVSCGGGHRRTLPPSTYVRRHGPHAGTPCGQTNHPPATCFKALDDAWFDRGNTAAALLAAPAAAAAVLPATAAAAVSSAAAAAAFSTAAAPTAAVLPAAAAAAVPSAAVAAVADDLRRSGHGRSCLPCLHIPTLRNNLLSHRELQGVGITAIYPGFAHYCDLYQTSSGRFLLRIPLCPRTRLYTLRTPRPSFFHIITRAGTSTGPPPPLPPPQVSPSPTSLPSSSLPTSSSTLSPSSSTALSHPAVILHQILGHPNFAALRTTVTSRLLHSLPPTLPPLPSSPAPPCPSCIHGKLKQSPITAIPPLLPPPLTLSRWISGVPVPSSPVRGTSTWSSSLTTTVGTPLSFSFTPKTRCRLLSSTGLSSATITSNAPLAAFTLTVGQNGIAESRIREITKIVCCLIAHASTPPSLWRYALLHAALLLNLRSHPQHPSSTPIELWSKAKPDAAGLRVWGCTSFILMPSADRSRAAGKLAPRALECVYLGHNRDSPDYLLLHLPTNRLIRRIDFVFDKSIPYYSTPPPDPLPPPSRPLAWTDTVLQPLLPPSPLLPPVTAPLPPSSSADVYDPAAPASPAHSAAPPVENHSTTVVS